MTDGQRNSMPDDQFISIVVDLVVARIDQRNRASRRWVVGVVIALIGAVFGGMNFAVETSLDDKLRADAQSRVSNRLGYLRDLEPFSDATLVTPGRTPVTLGPSERLPLAIQIPEPGMYRIEAISPDTSLEPIIYLYRQRSSGTAVDAIASNGDGRTSRIDVQLEADIFYYLEIEELIGAPGVIDVVLEQME